MTFTRARQTTERYAIISSDIFAGRGRVDIIQSVTVYHVGLRDDRQVTIEIALHPRGCAGAWNTSVLELDVDIGSFDTVLLDGYPGTQMATFQRASRTGRGTGPSLVAFVVSEDQLDQYTIEHPNELFKRTPERVVVNPSNSHLLKLHTHTTAIEGLLRTANEAHFDSTFPDIVSTLTNDDELIRRQTDQELGWRRITNGRTMDPYEQGPRTITERMVTLRVRGGAADKFGKLPLSVALRDVHPDAVYHH